MAKTFTCRELGGICDEKITGETFNDIVQKGSAHMMADEAHKEKIMNMGEGAETKEEWVNRVEKEFNDRKPDEELV